eukprot:2465234-Amphidinium_carterae.3
MAAHSGWVSCGLFAALQNVGVADNGIEVLASAVVAWRPFHCRFPSWVPSRTGWACPRCRSGLFRHVR